jgi:hypothetical protein
MPRHNAGVRFWWTGEQVVDWLARRGAIRQPGGLWTLRDLDGSLATNDLLHEIMDDALEDPDLSSNERLALGFGLLDEFDDYAAAMYLGFEFDGPDADHVDQIDLVWEFCRDVLERPDESEAVPYWLWVEWFEDPAWSSIAFAAVRGSLPARLAVDSADLRRLDRILRISGPVAWAEKRPLLDYAVQRPVLHSAAREAIAAAERDLYGQIDQGEAATLLARLRA